MKGLTQSCHLSLCSFRFHKGCRASFCSRHHLLLTHIAPQRDIAASRWSTHLTPYTVTSLNIRITCGMFLNNDARAPTQINQNLLCWIQASIVLKSAPRDSNVSQDGIYSAKVLPSPTCYAKGTSDIQPPGEFGVTIKKARRKRFPSSKGGKII